MDRVGLDQASRIGVGEGATSISLVHSYLATLEADRR
jgi:hypothetical protein